MAIRTRRQPFRQPLPPGTPQGRSLRGGASDSNESLGRGSAPPRSEIPTSHLPLYPTLPALPTLLFCVYVVCWYLQVGYRFPTLGAMRFELMYAIALGVFVVFRQPSLGSPLTGWLVALFACMAIQVPFSYDPTLSFDVFTDRVLKFAAMAMFIVAFVQRPKELKWFLAAFLLACLKMGQEGLWGQVTGSLVWQNQGIMRLHGSTLIYQHPNSFSGMALGTLPFVFFLYPLCNRRVKAVLLMMAAFAANIILFTGSRTGYVGFFGFVTFVVLRAKRRIRAAAAIILVGSIGLLFIPAEYAQRFESIYTGVEKEGRSSEARKEVLRDAWQIFLTHPFGIGVGAFPVVRGQMFERRADTHNLYLEVATNLGVQGLVVFALFITVQLRSLSKLGREFDHHVSTMAGIGRPPEPHIGRLWREHTDDLLLLRQTAYAVQGFLVVRLFLGLFGMDLYEIYWWFAVGLTIALYKLAEVARARTQVLAASASARAGTPELAVTGHARVDARRRRVHSMAESAATA